MNESSPAGCCTADLGPLLVNAQSCLDAALTTVDQQGEAAEHVRAARLYLAAAEAKLRTLGQYDQS